MSWPTWSATASPLPTLATPVQSTLVPAAINSAPSVMPPGLQYSPEQWAQAQQQNWQQWAQWQQQYQQWHQQYGAEYQKSMSAIQTSITAGQPPLPSMPNTGVPPPLPVENKPPLPPEEPPANQPSNIASYSTMPPKPAQGGYSTAPPPLMPQQTQPQQAADSYVGQKNWQSSQGNKRPYSQVGDYENAKRPLLDRPNQWGGQKTATNQWSNQQPPQNPSYHTQPPPQAQAKPPNIEELSEAEKKFDKEFAAWEAQFNKWKDQNASHPDKTQYLQYEKKWESWRNSLLERREQMRRKRVAMVAAAAGSKPFGYNQPPPQQPAADLNRAPSQPPPQYPPQQPTVESSTIKPTTPDPVTVNPPPHQNNEPLSFKPPSNTFPTEEETENAGEGFLKSSSTSGGIPGLDLVKEDDGNEPKQGDVVELDKEDKNEENTEKQGLPKGPDLDAISKGINTILGDQKLLSMLSIVSQNPPTVPPPNIATDSISNITSDRPLGQIQDHNFSAPPPPHQYNEGNFSAPAPPLQQFNEPPPQGNFPAHNEQSNQSYDDRSNQGDTSQQRESVNISDDQTRSSFTMGPSDQDSGFGGNSFSRNQNKFPPPNRFGGVPPENDRMNRGNFGPGNQRPGDQGFAPDNRNKFGPNRSDYGLGGSGNFPQSSGNFNQGSNFRRDEFNRGNNFNRNNSFNKGDGYDNFGRGDNFQNDKFGYNDGFNRSGNNFRRDDSAGFEDRRGNNSFDDRRGNFGGGGSNFNRSDSFNQRDNFDAKFDRGNDYDKAADYDEYDNYNEENDYDKYHDMFNDEEDVPPQSQNQGLPSRFMKQGSSSRIMNERGPPPRKMDERGPPPRMMDERGPPPRMMDERGPPPRMLNERGPPPRLDERGPLPRLMDERVPPPRLMDERVPPPGLMDEMLPPPRVMDERGPPPRMMDERGPPPRMLDERGPPPGMMDERGPRPRMMDQGPPPSSMMDAPPAVTSEPPPVEDAIFEPASVIDYEHKSQRPPELDVTVVPIHMFDYRHKPLNRIPVPQRPKWLSEAVKFIREFDPLVPRPTLNFERPPPERYSRDYGSRSRYDERDRRYVDDFNDRDRMERRPFNRSDRDIRENEDRNRRRFADDDRYDRRSNNEKPKPDVKSRNRRQDDFEELSDDDLNDDFESDEAKKHQQSHVERSRSRSPILSNPPNPASNEVTMIEDIINPPGRFNRPPRIVIILRGPPGSGKTYLAKVIKDKEVENGGSAPRILSLDDYFLVEHEKEVVEDGKTIKVKEMIYEYEAEMEESYRASFTKFFKKTITDGYFPFIIVDNVNDKVKYFGEMWSFAKQNGFQVYICQMDLDPVLCSKRNIHNRTVAELEECIAGWEPTPTHHPTLDASALLQSSGISEVEMEEVEQQQEETNKEEAAEDEVRSKWDTFDCSINNLAKLDGVSKPLRPSRTMEEYLQLEDEWEDTKPTKPGQKRVRWADLEEQRQQKKMRAIGFVVGHTNWDRMMDPTEGGSALTQTKYIDRIGRY